MASQGDLNELAIGLAERFLEELKGVPKHKLLVELGHRRKLVKELKGAELLRWHGTTAFPAFKALELLRADSRNRCRLALEHVIQGLRGHFGQNGPVPAGIPEITSGLRGVPIAHEEIQLGLHIAAEFGSLVRGEKYGRRRNDCDSDAQRRNPGH